MGKFFVRGVIYCLTAFLGLYNCPLVISSSDIKQKQIEAIDAQIIMDNLVKVTQTYPENDTTTCITYKDAQMLMKIAMAEAGAEGIEGKAMVMAVILNRVKDKRFPNTIAEVIFQEHQFSPISDGRYYEVVPDVECNLALAEIEKGTYNHIDALYFENADSSWQAENCEYLYTIGHHRFYKN